MDVQSPLRALQPDQMPPAEAGEASGMDFSSHCRCVAAHTALLLLCCSLLAPVAACVSPAQLQICRELTCFNLIQASSFSPCCIMAANNAICCAEGDDFADDPALAQPFVPKKGSGAPEEPGPSNPAQPKPAKGITAQLFWSPCRCLALMCAHPVCIVSQLQVDQSRKRPAQERDGLTVLFQGLLGTTFATTLYKACMASRSCYLSEAKAVSYMVGLIRPVNGCCSGSQEGYSA